MEKAKLQRNIVLYYVFQLLREPLFWGPIIIMYLQKTSHMSLSAIYFIESIAVVSIFFLEIPTGALADLLGRRLTIFIGLIFIVLQEVLLVFTYSPLMVFLSNNVMWVIGFSLISGADSSMLYDTLLALGREKEFKKIQGRSDSYRFVLVAICSISTGYLAEYYIRLPVILGLIPICLCCAVVYFFVDPPTLKLRWAGPPTCHSQKLNFKEGFNLIKLKIFFKEHVSLMKLSILFVANHKKIKWIIGFVAFIGVVSKLWFFTYNPYFELVGLSLKTFGYIFFGLNMVAAISSYYVEWLAKKFGEAGSIALMMILIVAPILAMGFFPCQGVAWLVLIQNVVRGYMKPFMDHFLHDNLDSDNRATTMSIKSAVVSFFQFLSLGIFGWILKLYSLPICLIILGLFSLICGVIIFVFYRRIFSRS